MCFLFFLSLPRRHITSNLRYYMLEQGIMHCIYTVTHEIAFNGPSEQEKKEKYNKKVGNSTGYKQLQRGGNLM